MRSGEIGADPTDNVKIDPNGNVWGENPDGTWTNHGPAENFTGSGKPKGRRGREELVLRYDQPVPSEKIPPRRQPASEAEPAAQPDEGAQPDGDVPPADAAPEPTVPPQLIERAPQQ